LHVKSALNAKETVRGAGFRRRLGTGNGLAGLLSAPDRAKAIQQWTGKARMIEIKTERLWNRVGGLIDSNYGRTTSFNYFHRLGAIYSSPR
jgi:hypothetical protein